MSSIIGRYKGNGVFVDAECYFRWFVRAENRPAWLVVDKLYKLENIAGERKPPQYGVIGEVGNAGHKPA